VDHGAELVEGEEFRGLVACGDVEEGEAEIGISLEARETRFLKMNVVVRIQVVDAVDRVAAVEEATLEPIKPPAPVTRSRIKRYLACARRSLVILPA
jgi:hypothetical protein